MRPNGDGTCDSYTGGSTRCRKHGVHFIQLKTAKTVMRGKMQLESGDWWFCTQHAKQFNLIPETPQEST